ncbi:MAG: hypothetical protein HYV47_01870 [Candidatus Nealsonbacteria bacterium]|nr:hypothetical protein [Candidatus Nealsonbacteria bacterium]
MKLLRKIVFYLFARPFVAGETIDDAVRVAHQLKGKNIYAIINILGEHVEDRHEVGNFFYQYLQLVSKLAREGLDGVHIAIKPSQLGIILSPYLFSNCLTILLKRAKLYLPHSLIEIDREDRAYAKIIWGITLALARDFSNLRICCQINLDETLEEIKQFTEAGISIRLVKGTAYPGDIKDEKEIRKRFFEQALFLKEKGQLPAIATHDLSLINGLQLETQVLLGIENKKMERLIGPDRKIGFYVPCGPNWYSYGKRRWKSIVKIYWRNFWYRILTQGAK